MEQIPPTQKVTISGEIKRIIARGFAGGHTKITLTIEGVSVCEGKDDIGIWAVSLWDNTPGFSPIYLAIRKGDRITLEGELFSNGDVRATTVRTFTPINN